VTAGQGIWNGGTWRKSGVLGACMNRPHMLDFGANFCEFSGRPFTIPFMAPPCLGQPPHRRISQCGTCVFCGWVDAQFRPQMQQLCCNAPFEINPSEMSCWNFAGCRDPVTTSLLISPKSQDKPDNYLKAKRWAHVREKFYIFNVYLLKKLLLSVVRR